MTEPDTDLGELESDLADRLRTLGAIFTDLGTDEGAQRLLAGMLSDDATDFNQLFQPYELPQFPLIGTCVWIREVLDAVLTTPTAAERCVLRADLTAAERLEVLALGRLHSILFLDDPGGQVIAPGPFLEELRRRHLVTCLAVTSHSRPIRLLGPYERFCV